MSLIKSIMHQLGLSGDPAKNFTLSVPAAPDGTMKLARGNAGATTQDIMTVDAAGKVDFKIGILGFEYGASGDRFYLKLPSWFGAKFLINWGSQAASTDVNGDVRFEYLVATVSNAIVIGTNGDDSVGSVNISYRPSGLLPLQAASFRCRVSNTAAVYAGSIRVNYISIGRY